MNKNFHTKDAMTISLFTVHIGFLFSLLSQTYCLILKMQNNCAVQNKNKPSHFVYRCTMVWFAMIWNKFLVQLYISFPEGSGAQMKGFVDTLRLQGHGVFNCNGNLKYNWTNRIKACACILISILLNFLGSRKILKITLVKVL